MSRARQTLGWLAVAVAAALAVGVSVVHVDDQGGLSAFTDPDWLGWAYRLIEVGGVLTALLLLSRRAATLAWVAAVGVGAGPFVGYVLSRTTGIPGDSDDKGVWSDPVGTASLVLEGLLVLVALGALVAGRSGAVPSDAAVPRRRHGALQGDR